MSSWPDYVVVADPASLRWQHYLPELREFVQRFDPQPRIHLVPWSDLIEADGDLSCWAPKGQFLLRIESPARNFEVFRALLRCGQRQLGEAPSPWAYDRGWITSPRRLHLGFCSVLSNLSAWVRDHKSCRPTSDLQDTQSLFDKNFVSELLQQNRIPTPEAIRPRTAEEVQAGLARRGWTEAFLKLAYGSCASGIVRLRCEGSAPWVGETTIRKVNDRFYNSYQVHSVTSVELQQLIDFVTREIATLQQAVDKTRCHGDGFDVRVVVVNREVVATVFRASPLPMTNLHLGGYRADPQDCRRRISQRAWAEGMEVCRLASELFQLAALGIDLAFDRVSGEPQILEINSFGDFLPHWRDSQGRTVHRIEIEATARRERTRE
jgi:glutathione synthase/RimK-type ligase-like ATP-grasp enzyme